ncbi:uncharacterized protein LOC119397030 [Rhipicephalus sanguineus]|uniref:uncharacterized protein LOC119397030 n=1 Tax=Rhipicephalus sanguineus TaxID=34632 RepID=UPI001895DF35|nr:uncharacterized protein LOC119397030 [Rhipicephalus sanguineus]
MGFKWSCGNLLNSTNNRCETINARLKGIIDRYSSLEDFIKKFFSFVYSMRREATHKAATIIQKRRVICKSDLVHVSYSNLLTPYAFKHIEHQLDLSSKVTGESDDGRVAQVVCNNKSNSTSATECTCEFSKAMFLPCCHIFAVRRHFGLNEYDDALCSQRWAASLYAQSATILLNDDGAKESEALHIEQQKNHRILSSHQKFRKAPSVTAKLASIVSEGSMGEFSRKMELLEDLLCHWKNGIDVKLEKSEESSEGANTKCARGSSTDECSVNLLENNDEAASDEDADDTSPDVTTSPAKIGTAVRMQVADLQDELTDVHRKGSGQPLLAEGTMEEDGETTRSQQDILLQRNDGALATKLHGTNQTLSTSVPREIKVPPAMKKCGRPKGHTLTVIGLPKRKATSERVPFKQLSMREKKKIILSWLVGEEKAKAAMQGKQLEESDVEQRPELIHCGVMDENVDINCVQSIFSKDAWAAVASLLTCMKTLQKWECGMYNDDLDNFDSIMCDWCLSWYHLPCVHLRKQPKAKVWQCSNCE